MFCKPTAFGVVLSLAARFAVPIAYNDHNIIDLAYLLWQKAGRPAGMEHEFWADAQAQIEGPNDHREKPRTGVAR